MPRVFDDPFVDGKLPTVEDVPYADLPVRTVLDLALHGDSDAVTWLNEHRGRLTAAGDWDESRHPRDERGRFGDSGTTEPRSTFISRADEHTTPDPAVTAYAIKSADDFAANSNEHAFAYTGGNGQEKWEPGSAEALSETMSAWQTDYDQSYEMQVGADMLMGYGSTTTGSTDGGWTDGASIAEARELLSAMADGPPPGAESVHEALDEASLDRFGENELARGYADEDGTMLRTLRDALDSGGTVQWSMASFVDARNDPDGMAPNAALSYALHGGESSDPRFGPLTPKDNPLVIRTDGQGLDLGGHFEVLVGGTFSVRNIRGITADERDAWGAPAGSNVTVVDLHQEQNVTPPAGVSVR